MSNTSEALPRIRKFMDEMKVWESIFYSKKMNLIINGVETFALDEEYRKKLRVILEEYVVDAGKNYGRIIDLGAGDPTAYDFSTDQVESTAEAGDKVVHTYKRSTGFENTYRFTLQKKQGHWLILKKELFSHDEKWTAIPI